MKAEKLLFLFGVLVVSLCTVQAATVYRWTDGNGVIHFSQTPPVSRPYQQIEPQLPPPTSAPAVNELGPLVKHYQTRQAQARKAHESQVKHAAEREAACAKARQRISYLEAATAHRLFIRKPDGTRARMTEPQFEKLLNQARQAANENCRNSRNS